MIFDDKYFIGRKIKSFRKKRGLTQAELAEKIDLSENILAKLKPVFTYHHYQRSLKLQKHLKLVWKNSDLN